MTAGNPAFLTDQIKLLLDQVASEIIDLPVDRKERIESVLQQIKSCVNAYPPQAEKKNTHSLSETKERLAASEAKYRELAEAITDPFNAYDSGLRLVYRNKASAELTQIPDEQALGQTFTALYPQLVGSATHQVYVQALETHQPQKHLSYWIRPSDGQAFYHDLSVYPTSAGLFAISKDVTKRVRAEKALQKSEAMFSQTFQSSPVAQGVLRARDLRIMDVNETFLEQTGFTRQEVIGHTGVELGVFTNLADHENLHLSEQQEKIRNRAIKIRIKTGDIRTLLISFEPIELNGEACFLMTGIDITERVRAEEALNERNQALERAHIELVNERNRLLAVLQALPVGMAIMNAQGGQIQANPTYETIWGNNRPDVNTINDYREYRAWWAETGEPLQPEDWASAQAVLKGEAVVGQFIQIQKFDGSLAYVVNSAAPTLDANNQVTGCAVAIMDITQMIEAENALHASQDRFRVALNSVPIFVYTCDPDLRYTWIYRPIRGYRTEDLLGKRDDEIIPPAAAAEIIAAKQMALDTGQGGMQEVKVGIEGEIHYYILTTDPIRNKHGGITGLTCSAIDITAQKRLEAGQREQAIEIEVQHRLMNQRELDRYSVARDLHDGPIQTLSSTMFNLQMIKEAFPDLALQAELNKIRLDIKATIHELREAMNELRPPALVHFGFSKVIQLYLQDFHERFPEMELALDLAESDKVLPPQTHLNLFRIFQAGINNIIRHSGASKIWVTYKIEQGSFYLELRDNGCGFDRSKDFSQLTREGHFGLVGMKERAGAIDATFSVLSEPEKGTTIVVRGLAFARNMN